MMLPDDSAAAFAPARDDGAEAEALPAAPGAWAIRTRSGSVYRVRLDEDGRWWLSADNVVNPVSRSLADGEWEIIAPLPWPPVVGEPLLLEAVPGLARGDVRRVPGGGKMTSDVCRFSPLPSLPGDPSVSPPLDGAQDSDGSHATPADPPISREAP